MSPADFVYGEATAGLAALFLPRVPTAGALEAPRAAVRLLDVGAGPAR